MQWETASLFWFVRNLEMAPSGRVTPHSVGRCRASDRGARLRSSPAKRVGERAYNKVRDREIVSPSVSFADSSLTEGALTLLYYLLVYHYIPQM